MKDLEIFTITNSEDIISLYPEADSNRKIKIKTDIKKDIGDAAVGNRIIYGARLKGKIVGTIQLVFRMDKTFYADGKAKAHLHHARVRQESRGIGIGSYLVKIITDEARARKFKEVTLGVEETNINAVKLYERLGYKEFMREEGDEGEIIIGMSKKL